MTEHAFKFGNILIGVDYASADDSTMMVTATLNPDDTMTVISATEIKSVKLPPAIDGECRRVE